MDKKIRTIRVYKSYSFRDKDPVIYKVKDVLRRENVSRERAALDSGVTISTLANWFDGPTKRPQFATLNAVLRAVGYELTPTRIAKKK